MARPSLLDAQALLHRVALIPDVNVEAGKFRPVRRADGTPVGVVIAMAEDRDNNIWAEAIGSPSRPIRIQDFTVREEIPAPQVPVAISLAADPQGGIWLGLVNGDLARWWSNSDTSKTSWFA